MARAILITTDNGKDGKNDRKRSTIKINLFRYVLIKVNVDKQELKRHCGQVECPVFDPLTPPEPLDKQGQELTLESQGAGNAWDFKLHASRTHVSCCCVIHTYTTDFSGFALKVICEWPTGQFIWTLTNLACVSQTVLRTYQFFFRVHYFRHDTSLLLLVS